MNRIFMPFIVALVTGLVNSDPDDIDSPRSRGGVSDFVWKQDRFGQRVPDGNQWGSNGPQWGQNGFKEGSNQWRSNSNPWGSIGNQDGFGEGGNRWRPTSSPWGSNGNQDEFGEGGNRWRPTSNPWGSSGNQDGFGEGGNRWRPTSNPWGSNGNQWNQDGFGERENGFAGRESWRQGTGSGNFGGRDRNPWGAQANNIPPPRWVFDPQTGGYKNCAIIRDRPPCL